MPFSHVFKTFILSVVATEHSPLSWVVQTHGVRTETQKYQIKDYLTAKLKLHCFTFTKVHMYLTGVADQKILLLEKSYGSV